MTLSHEEIATLPGAAVYDRVQELVGTVGQVWADRDGRPVWVSVHTGGHGAQQSFMPLAGAQVADGRVHTPYPSALVSAAPRLDVDAQQPPDGDASHELYAHYALTLDDDESADDDAMIRSEERLSVDTRTEVTGRARLRKYVVTEYVTVTVPVKREKVRLERVPAGEETTGDADIVDAPVGDAGEAQHEIVLHEERPVVTTETVPVERVRLSKEIVTDTETVTGEVRKEKIDLETPDEPDRTID